MAAKLPSTYNAHETHRMQEVHGLPLASFWRRAGAFLLDMILAAAVLTLGVWGVAVIMARMGHDPGDIKLQIDFKHWYSLVTLVIYFALWTYFTNGRTPGKWIFGIRVVSLAHGHMSFWHSTERALGYGASALEFGFGFVQYFIHPNKRTVHDRIAETIVVREPKRVRKTAEKPEAS